MSASPTLHYSSYGTITPTRRLPSLRSPPRDDGFSETGSSPSSDSPGTLHRGLSSRQVQMIAIAGTIGTGLFLGTGRSLAQGGPASMLICYSIVSFIVYVTLLLLGEMATQYPIAGECFSVSLAVFAEERSCASITFLSFSFLVSTYKCTESTEKFISCVLLHLAIWELILVTCTSR
jgi:amino acid permease